MGRASDRWMARSPSPHYGGYTTHAVESGDPPHGVIVVVVVAVAVAAVAAAAAVAVVPWSPGLLPSL